MNRLTLKMVVTALCALVICCTGNSKIKENKVQTMNTKAEIYLAGGCFWGTEHYLKQIDGVLETQTGYANGHGKNPSYQEVNGKGGQTAPTTIASGGVATKKLL